MKSHLLLTFLVCELIFPVHALPALFNIRGADAPASIEGVASILNGGDFGGKSNPLTKVALEKGFGRLPLSFEVNEGQTDAQVKFLSRGRGYTLFLTPTEAVLRLTRIHKSISPTLVSRL